MTAASPPGIQFVAIRKHRITGTMGVPIHRHAFQSFPSLNGSNAAVKKRCDAFPRIEALSNLICAWFRKADLRMNYDGVFAIAVHRALPVFDIILLQPRAFCYSTV
jgi:hypothetical protein